MTEKIKLYRIVLSYDVQKSFLVEAKDEDEAYNKAYHDWQGDMKTDHYEYRDNIEKVEVGKND